MGGIMHILVIGAAGMVGRKLTQRLVSEGKLDGKSVDALTLVDVIEPEKPAGFTGKVVTTASDFSLPGEAEKLLLENQKDGYFPKVIFTSSIAVVGAPLPYPIPDEFHLTPLTSYGTQKAVSELLLADYSRRGFFDGIGIRLPTVCIRPGKPNKAASGFFSGILREPLVGQEAILPVSEDVRHWHTSPRSAVGFLIHAAGLDLTKLGWRRSLSMPGVSATVGEQIEALRRAAGEDAVKLIRRQPDEMIMKMVAGWAPGFEAKRATELGFTSEKNFDEIIQVHIEDELGGKL